MSQKPEVVKSWHLGNLGEGYMEILVLFSQLFYKSETTYFQKVKIKKNTCTLVWLFTKAELLHSTWPSDTTPKYEMKTYIHTETCTRIFTAVLIITVKKWKQAKGIKCGIHNWILYSNKIWSTDACYN